MHSVPDHLKPPPPLADLIRSRPIALFLDFDGTLVDIADTPDAILVPESLSARLGALSDRLGGRLALVSGRGIGDVERHCGPIAVAIAGSHGAARRVAGGEVGGTAMAPVPAGVVAEVEAFAKAHLVGFERKPHGAALHSRENPEREDECLAFLVSLAEEHGLAIKRGKMVVELVHPGADKGAAVHAFMAVAPFAGSTPVFVGDDITDEDGFAACERQGGFGISVGERNSALARYNLADTAAVQQWLQL
jgi:trehalose 6-phosphate phosphatase